MTEQRIFEMDPTISYARGFAYELNLKLQQAGADGGLMAKDVCLHDKFKEIETSGIEQDKQWIAKGVIFAFQTKPASVQAYFDATLRPHLVHETNQRDPAFGSIVLSVGMYEDALKQTEITALEPSEQTVAEVGMVATRLKAIYDDEGTTTEAAWVVGGMYAGMQTRFTIS